MKKRQSVLSRDARARGEGDDERVSSTASDKGRGEHVLVSL